jgi:Skp family chaperone for outer membrane proteins
MRKILVALALALALTATSASALTVSWKITKVTVIAETATDPEMLDLTIEARLNPQSVNPDKTFHMNVVSTVTSTEVSNLVNQKIMDYIRQRQQQQNPQRFLNLAGTASL